MGKQCHTAKPGENWMRNSKLLSLLCMCYFWKTRKSSEHTELGQVAVPCRTSAAAGCGAWGVIPDTWKVTLIVCAKNQETSRITLMLLETGKEERKRIELGKE